jgi:hypothetical protein
LIAFLQQAYYKHVVQGSHSAWGCALNTLFGGLHEVLITLILPVIAKFQIDFIIELGVVLFQNTVKVVRPQCHVQLDFTGMELITCEGLSFAPYEIVGHF